MLQGVNRYRDVVTVGTCLLVPAFLLYVQSRSEAEAGPAMRALIAATAPLQHAMGAVVATASDAWHDHVQEARSLADARRLRGELASLRRVAERVAELERENERLRALLNAHPTPAPGRVVAARVVAVGASALYRTVRVDVGRDDGVRRGMAVVNAEGAVGSVLRTSSSYADVLLLEDRQSALDVVLPRTGTRGLARGTGEAGGGRLRVEGLERSDDVRVGDGVVTSGLGARFPRGVVVGTVEAVVPMERGRQQVALVTPAVSFGRLGVLLVALTPEESVLPPRPPPAADPAPEEPTRVDAGTLGQLVEAPPAWAVLPDTDGGETARPPAEESPGPGAGVAGPWAAPRPLGDGGRAP
jgi:rod shape-determining protein MreC